MIIETLSTFPDMFTSYMNASMMKRAQDKHLLSFHSYNLRNWTNDKHRSTDDTPYGGGPGLVMTCQPIFDAVHDICHGICAPRNPYYAWEGEKPVHTNASDAKIVFLTPTGVPFSDALACEMCQCERLLFVCGHYEGIDERAFELADYQLSIGDYVLTSGELASMVVIDAIVRKIDGVLGADDGVCDESFVSGLLEAPQYTRPAVYEGRSVPEVLLSGDHAKIKDWKIRKSLQRTLEKRPDLLDDINLESLDAAHRNYLHQLQQRHS